jgi:NTP pyrophosphatase (non-canonical NTP hydrolase)
MDIYLHIETQQYILNSGFNNFIINSINLLYNDGNVYNSHIFTRHKETKYNINDIKNIINTKDIINYITQTSNNEYNLLCQFNNFIKNLTNNKNIIFYTYNSWDINNIITRCNGYNLDNIVKKHTNLCLINNNKLIDLKLSTYKFDNVIKLLNNKNIDSDKIINIQYCLYLYWLKTYLDKLENNKETIKENIIIDNFGYHTKEIQKGVLGEFSKIKEEFEELEDAVKQDNDILILCELSDIIGAIEAYSNKHNISLEKLIQFSNSTKKAFENGKR